MSDFRPICVSCNERYSCKRNGVTVAYTSESIQAADLWECPSCHYQIVIGFSQKNLSKRECKTDSAKRVYDSYLKNMVAGPGVDVEQMEPFQV